MPSLVFELPILALLGAAAVTFAASDQLTLQLAVAPGNARPGDGALLGRLPRLDSDRRAALPAGSRRPTARG